MQGRKADREMDTKQKRTADRSAAASLWRARRRFTQIERWVMVTADRQEIRFPMCPLQTVRLSSRRTVHEACKGKLISYLSAVNHPLFICVNLRPSAVRFCF